MKRVRFDGVCLSKFDMANIMDSAYYRNLPWIHMYDAFTYEEVAYFFNDYLESIKNNSNK